MWGMDNKDSWAPKNWFFWTMVLEKILEGPLACKEIKPVSPKGNQPRMFTGRTDAEAEALVVWPPDAKSQLIRKDPDAGKEWRQEKRATEDEMVVWHHRLNGCEFEQTQGDSEEQRGLVCCSSWDLSQTRLSDWTTTDPTKIYSKAQGWELVEKRT